MTRFEVEKIGTVEMVGKGPWQTKRSGSITEIYDSEDRRANPTIIQSFSGTGRKPNRNVIFANAIDVHTIVEKANSLFAAAAPDTSDEVDG